MPNIKPLRDYSEHEVLNLFGWSGSALPISKGTICRIVTGVHSDLNTQIFNGSPGATYPNVLSPRWEVQPRVGAFTTTGANDALGITLLDIREVDEHGNKLLFSPQSQYERSCVLSGQQVPILTRGLLHFSGIDGTPAGGTKLYPTGGTNLMLTTTVCGNPVGTALGPKDSQGYVFVKFDF